VTSVVPFVKGARTAFLQSLATPLGTPENRKWRRKVRKFFGRHSPGTDLKGEHSRNVVRSVLTALITTRCLVYPPRLNVQSIRDLPYGPIPDRLVKYVRAFWRRLGFGLPSELKNLQRSAWNKYHLSTKAGPNGPAMWSALSDLASLPETLVASIGYLGGETLHGNMKVLLRNLRPLSQFFPVRPGRIRKVVSISDKEKPRTIAILDYWSQTCLRPLHFFLFSVLKKIPQDVTFDQGSYLKKVEPWKSVEYFSIDLKDATDRFPIILISQVLQGAFTGSFVSHWVNIMVGYPFSSAEGDVSYGAGNPMGAYSSWSSFALAHHFVVFVACVDSGIEWSTARYVLLGDDILIGDRTLANAYRSVISSLWVVIQQQKTFESGTTHEFAKR
jgi:hypothetical protein